MAADLSARIFERQQKETAMTHDLGVWIAEDCALAPARAVR
jgi:hypothetical protein